MNGGVSLAVWIGGVTRELARFSNCEGCWDEYTNGFARRFDVLTGTSAGGINAAFLALAELYEIDLGPLRDLWLDQAGLEPASDEGTHLLREPGKRPSSLLDGEYFRQQLHKAFDSLLPSDDGGPTTSRPDHPLDLRLTTTSLEGRAANVEDAFGGIFRSVQHDVLFHFRHRLDNRSDFQTQEPRRGRLVTQLARAARSTAAFPFAFDPSTCDADRFPETEPSEVYEGILEPNGHVRHHLLDGGVLNNLPVDLALEAIFAMPASGPVSRFLVAVVPDPSTDDPQEQRVVSTKDIAVGSLIGIPRNRSVAGFLREVKRRNAQTRAHAASQAKLWQLSHGDLLRLASRLWPSYEVQRRIRSLAAILGEERLSSDDAETVALPWLPSDWRDPSACWGASTVRRLVAALLDLMAVAGDAATAELRLRVHTAREEVDSIDPLHVAIPRVKNVFVEARSAGQAVAEALATALASWPEAPPRVPESVDERRKRLAAALDGLAYTLVDLAQAWQARPAALARLVGAEPRDDRMRKARTLLCALEVVGSASGGLEHDAQQDVTLGILTPLCKAPLDPCGRETAKKKLAGDELGHFGAFLKRSWRANDWMWGRLDAVTFLFVLLRRCGVLGEAEANAGCIALQKEIIREEAPVIVQAVERDRVAGAKNLHGRKLLPQAEGALSDLTWTELTRALQLDLREPERDFLARNRIGEEVVRDEQFTPLMSRVGTKAVATGGAVLQQAGLPFPKLVGRGIAPIRGLVAISHRYARNLRAPAPARALMSAIALLLGAAAVGLIDLFAADLGVLAPLAWTLVVGGALVLVVLAPLTTVLGLLFVAAVGLAASLPERMPRWLDPNQGDWEPAWLPLPRPVAIMVILATLALMAVPFIDAVDRRWRESLERGRETVDHLRRRFRP